MVMAIVIEQIFGNGKCLWKYSSELYLAVNCLLYCLICNIKCFNTLFLNLTGKYLLPNGNGQQLWQPAETSNLVRMRCQALGQSAPSLTVSSVSNFFKAMSIQQQQKNISCISVMSESA